MSDILKDSQDDMTNLEDMTRKQLIGQIMYLRCKVSWLLGRVEEMTMSEEEYK